MKLEYSIILASLASVAASVAATVCVSDRSLKVSEYNLISPKIREELNIIVLSDLHMSVYGKDNHRLIKLVNGLKPDMILLPGDFFDIYLWRDSRDRTVSLLKNLVKIAPTFMSYGNHDLRYNIKTGEDVSTYAKNAGVYFLDGEYMDVKIKNQTVRVGGVYDHASYLEDFNEEWQTSKAYKFITDFQNTGLFKVLMLHRPNTFIFARQEWDIDAVVSGHDHGGIWRVPFLGALYAPEQGAFPKYVKGEFDLNGARLFISTGLEGYYDVPRVLNRPEIMKITVSGDENGNG